MRVIEFFVPGPPAPLPRMTSKSKWGPRAQRAFQWRNDLGWAAKAEGAEMIEGPAGVIVRIYTPDPLKHAWDGDNVLKNVQDGLQGICYENDKTVVLASVRVLPCDGREPGTLVVVGPSEEVEWQR